MKATSLRALAAIVLAAVCWLLLAGASAKKESVLQPDKLIIISTTDVKGKTSPCG
jgi:hypothetical protein